MFHYGEKTKELLQTRHHVSYNSPVWRGLRGSILTARRRSVNRGSDMPLACHSTPLPFEPGINFMQSFQTKFENLMKFNLLNFFGADYGARTRHLNLGKVALYRMS